ncbi:MAG: nuclear transport factor 2 family protein [Bacteroidia bacterium]|nr:nuclear transport factor 2 family protein [Bacteroidia bacterium]
MEGHKLLNQNINLLFIIMRTIVPIVLSTILFISSIACKNANIKNDQKYTDDNHPVRTLYLSSIKALNEGNLDLFLANFAPEIKMYGTDGNYFGQNQLRERFENVLQQFPNVRMEIPELELEILSKNIVLVNFKWKVFPMGQGPAFSGLGSGVYMKHGDKWMEILEVETITNVDKALKQN